MRTKSEKKARRDEKVKEWRGVFIREYQLQRGYGERIKTALVNAIEALNDAVQSSVKGCPQDKMFFLDCKIELQSQLCETAAKIEHGEAVS